MTIQAGIRGKTGEIGPWSGEVLYSRTDRDGVIRAVNDAFLRVSGFSATELIGAPHRVVRHSDTPRILFRLLWSRLGRGEPAAAFMRNRTKSGESYWVFSLMLPCRGGYVSVQLPPGGDLFARVAPLYEEACAEEDAGCAAESGEAAQDFSNLYRRDRKHGFSSYESFVTCAVGQEIAAHDAVTGVRADPRSRILVRMSEAVETGMQEQLGLQRSFDALQLIPNNMRIVASRLEPSGGPISAIAENYKASSQVISRRLGDFVGSEACLCESVVRDVGRTMILLGGVRILSELLDGSARSRSGPQRPETTPETDWDSERQVIAATRDQSRQEVRNAIRHAIDAAAKLNRASIEIRRHMLGLDTIRVLGRVECCRIPDAGGLAATIDQLDAFHAQIKSRLEAIMQTSEVVGSAMGDLLRAERQPA